MMDYQRLSTNGTIQSSLQNQTISQKCSLMGNLLHTHFEISFKEYKILDKLFFPITPIIFYESLIHLLQ